MSKGLRFWFWMKQTGNMPSFRFNGSGNIDKWCRLLDLGFQAALSRIITHLPKQRRTGLFSATMTDADALSELVRVGLRNPARITVKVQSKKTKIGTGSTKGEIVEERRTPAKYVNFFLFLKCPEPPFSLQNYYLTCQASEKLIQLTRIIAHEVSQHKSSHFIVYFATCACVDYFYKVRPCPNPSFIWPDCIQIDTPSFNQPQGIIPFTARQPYSFGSDKNTSGIRICAVHCRFTLDPSRHRCSCSRT